jgi:hypothetical protein
MDTMDTASLMDKLLPTYRHSYTHRDLILYNLGVGCQLPDDRDYLQESGEQGGVKVVPTCVAGRRTARE